MERATQPSQPEQPGGAPAQERQAVRIARQLDSLAEQRIREAAERGAFNNLSTHGRPVDLDLNDAIDRDAWFVSRTMKSLGAVPDWIELGKEIDADEARLRWMARDFVRWLDETRAALRGLGDTERAQRRHGVGLRFEDRFARYVQLAGELRVKIDRFNLRVPVRTLEKPGIWLAHERDRLLAPYEAFLLEQGWDRELDPSAVPAAPLPSMEPRVEPPARTGARRLLSLWRALRRR